MIESEISVLGAGPAGATAALFLSNAGVKCTLIDKSPFPRDKVCGDCLGGYAISVLRQLGDDIFTRFTGFEKKIDGLGVRFFSPGLHQLSVKATNMVNGVIHEFALCRRNDFDNFLFEEAANRNEISIHTGIEVYGFRKSDEYLVFQDRDKKDLLKTKLAIVATGSQSRIAGELSSYKNPKKNLAGGIRAYYRNIKESGSDNFIEFHFLKEILPGYLWIFPLGDSYFNVGIGQRSDVISQKKTDLRKILPFLIDSYPYLKDRFENAEMISPPAGFPLALGSAKRSISGDNFLLAGDAASLIEPFFGEGIGNAMYSGKFAAEQAIRCMEQNEFSSVFNRSYDRNVYRKVGGALKMSTYLQKAAFHPWLIDRVFRNIEKKPVLEQLLTRIINGDIAREPGLAFQFLVRSVAGI